MTLPDSTLRWQRWVLVAVLLGSAVLLLPRIVEPFMLVKATWIVVGAVMLLVLGGVRAVWTRQLTVPMSAAMAAIGAYALALVVATATSATTMASVIGFYGRYTGLVPYLALLTVLLVVVRLQGVDDGLGAVLLRTAVVAQAVVVPYGLLQALGADPFDFRENGLGATFSTMGNVNFGGAYAGALSGVLLVVALSPQEPRAWRITAGALLPLTAWYVIVTGTVQGPLVLAASAGVAGLLLATGAGGPVARVAAERGRPLLLAAGSAVVAVPVAAAVVFRDRVRAELDASLVERRQFWAAAVDIFRDNPLLGTGLDTYAHHFLAYRPASHARMNLIATTDAPHSVPLGMFTNGGLVLGLAYLALVAVVTVALVRGALSVQGPQRGVLAAFGGMWIGYLLQSLISFDMPPLALLGYLSAGMLLALGAPPTWRTVDLPGRRPEPKLNKRGRPVGVTVVPLSSKVLAGAVCAVGLVLTWLAAYPLRADVVAAAAAPLTQSGRLVEAAEKFERAAALNPAEASYTFLLAQVRVAAGDVDGGLAAAQESIRRDPGTVQYPLFAARQAKEAGRLEQSLQWYERAVEVDPLDPPILNEAAVELLERGDAERAERLLATSVEVRPDAENLVLLGQARVALDDLSEARRAFERALEISPQDPKALEQLALLPSSA